jgi:CCR4-NOT transcription complex subunit 1
VPGLEPTALDNAVNTVTADNLDLGCRMIEKAAHDKAVTDIDARLAAGYAVRLSQTLSVHKTVTCLTP